MIFLGYIESSFKERFKSDLKRKSFNISLLLNNEKSLSVDIIKNTIEVFHKRGERILIVNRDKKIVADSWNITSSDWRYYTTFMYKEGYSDKKNYLYDFLMNIYYFFRQLKDDNNYEYDKTSFLKEGDLYLGKELEDAFNKRIGEATRIEDNKRAEIYYYSHKVGNSGYYTVVSGSTIELIFNIDVLRNSSLNQFLILFIINFIVSILISLALIVPVIKLNEKIILLTKSFRQKDYIFPTIERKDEIGDLSRAIQKLFKNLKKHLDFSENYSHDIVHELKNPLATIRSAVDMIEADGNKELLDIINRNISRTEYLIGDLREVTLIDTRLDLENKIKIYLNGFLDSMTRGYQLHYPHLKIQYINIGDVNPKIVASEHRIEQIINCIVDNASDFTNSKIDIILKANEGRVTITIEDNGKGIDEGSFDTIFDRFYSSRRDKNRHTGLGLAIAKAIITGYNGSVEAINNKKGGASFIITLNTL